MSGRLNPNIVSTWQNGVEAVEEGRLREAAGLFWDIRHFSAKIWFNLSIVDLLLGDVCAADEKLKECVQRDEYLAVGYFQRGVIACQQGRLAEGRDMFTKAHSIMRTADCIDYKQLGLAVCLTREQIEHNLSAVNSYLTSHRATTKISSGELESVPACLFRPARSLVENIRKQSFLQKAKVISSYPEFAQNKDRVTANKTQSSSAPTSPSTRHKMGGTSRASTSHTPPPTRPPPRLPPSASFQATGKRYVGNRERKEGAEERGRVSGMRQQAGSSCSPGQTAGVSQVTESTRPNPAGVSQVSGSVRPNPAGVSQDTESVRPNPAGVAQVSGSTRPNPGSGVCQCICVGPCWDGEEPVSTSAFNCFMGSGCIRSNDTGHASQSQPSSTDRQHQSGRGAESDRDVLCSEVSVASRIHNWNDSGGVGTDPTRSDSRLKVEGQRSGPETEVREANIKVKPARPPLPKFMS